MRTAIFLLGTLFFIPALAQDVKILRNSYYEAARTKNAAEQFAAEMQRIPANSGVLVEGYRGMSYMLLARYSMNPYTKLKNFKKGRDLLEKAISRDTLNVENRFLRYGLQTNAPPVLGYRDQLANDRRFLTAALARTSDDDLKAKIITYLKHAGN